MQTLHWMIAASLVLTMFLLIRIFFSRTDLGSVPCGIRSFASYERRKFWSSLQQAVGDDYVVLANVPLATLITTDGDKSGPLQDWLTQHWADFAILDEKLYTPVVIVQFERQAEDEDPFWPKGKDKTLRKVLAQAGLALLWLPSDQYQHIELLRHALEQARANAQPPEAS